MDQLYFPKDIRKLIGCNATALAMEKAGKFPKRIYLKPDAPRPSKPAWLRSEVDKWLADRAAEAEASRARAGLLGARLVLAKRRKAEEAMT